VAIIRNGEVIRLLEMSALEQDQASVTIRADGITPAICSGLSAWGQDIRADGNHLTLSVPNETAMPEITRFLVAQGAAVYQITPQRMSLEELFIETVGKDAGL
jgi:ABC-2 type transport system ATP-binding protein